MRWLASLTAVGALVGSLTLVASVRAQSLSEHAAAAAGATVGTAAGKPLSHALTTIFGAADNATSNAAGTKPAATKEPPRMTESKPAPTRGDAGAAAHQTSGPAGSGEASGKQSVVSERTTEHVAGSKAAPTHASASLDAASAQPVAPPVPFVPPAPREPSRDQLSSIQVGASGRDVVGLLGEPSSHVSIPDDDGHLRESLQFWAQGRPLGTVRLDNGQVVKVDVLPY